MSTGQELVPALVRVAANAWLRSTAWGLETSLRVGTRLARAATSPESAAELVDELRSGLRTYARELLGVADLDERVRQLMPPGAGSSRRMAARGGNARQPSTLRQQGAELLLQSADVSAEDGIHPAYARILSELAPDEARILRLLVVEGPQPIIDVHAANLIGVGSQLVARGLSMIGPEAGVRHRDRVPAYLNNLQRLGLIEISREPVDDPIRYQVLEAQPEALGAIKSATRAKTIHRSIRLTPFGKDFCDVCIPTDPAEIEALGEARLDG
jgi:Abortive infection alpha